jgi:Uma2 family endonuclease
LILPPAGGIVVAGSPMTTTPAATPRRRSTRRRGRMTLREYFETPESVTPQQLAFGVLHVADSPTTFHQAAVASLFLALHEHVRPRQLGTVWLAPLDVVLDAERALVVQPDLFVVCPGGAADVGDKVFGPPDLVVEVLSPAPRVGEIAERVTWFREYGVRECWLVHQLSRSVETLRFAADGGIVRRTWERSDAIQSAVLPDFDLSPEDIFGY